MEVQVVINFAGGNKQLDLLYLQKWILHNKYMYLVKYNDPLLFIALIYFHIFVKLIHQL